MKCLKISCFAVLCLMTVQICSTAVLEQFISGATACEKFCDSSFSDADLSTSCKKGCRLFTIIGLAKDLDKDNKTEQQCFTACQEAFQTGPKVKACNDGCKKEASTPPKPKENDQTLHLLTPLMYVRSAYKTVAHHVKQLVTTSFTLYIEEDTGKMVVLQTNPKTIVDLPDYNTKNAEKDAKSSVRNWQSERSDWMDCISQQSGLPRWILVSVLFGFIVALLWLCCVTTVTAPNHHLNSSAKALSTKTDIGYLYMYEPVDKFKIQPPSDDQAPLLPVKVNLA